MGVKLREKKLKNGNVSLYLDIYQNKTRWKEYLDIHINKRGGLEDKEKKQLAIQIRAKRETELIVQDNEIIDKNRKKINFIVWFEKFIEDGSFHRQYSTSLSHLKKYMGAEPLPFYAITPVWIQGYARYLLGKVINNTARSYLMNMFHALETAVVHEIIPTNPFRKIPPNERLKKQEILRDAFTLEQLQHLADTPCNIHPQIKQAFFFSCFTGLRWSDVNPLRWSEIICKQVMGKTEHFIYFEQEKTEGIEYFPLSDQAVEIILERKAEAKASGCNSPYVFPCIKEYDEVQHLMHRKVGRALKKWGLAAGFEEGELHFHAARHSFATNVLENSTDGDLLTVSKLLGHKSIQSTQIYAHIRDSRKFSAVKSLPKLSLIKLAQQSAA